MIYLLVFFAACGIGLVLWCLLGILLIPVFDYDMITICRAEGDGEGLEQKIRGYGWLRDGRLTGGRLIILNCGLTERGMEIARHLCRRYDWVSRYDGPLPAEFLAEKQDDDTIFV